MGYNTIDAGGISDCYMISEHKELTVMIFEKIKYHNTEKAYKQAI